MTKKLISIIILLILTACATSTALVPDDQLIPVPAERITWNDSKNPASGTLIIIKDPGLLGKNLRVMISIDGIPAGQIKPGEIVKFKIDAGKRMININSYYGLTGELANSQSSLIDIKSLSEYKIHIGVKSTTRGV